MSRSEKIYQRLPIRLQNVVCSWIGWRRIRARFGRGFRLYLQQAEERMQWPEDRLLAYRDQRLHEVVQYCAKTVPYYRKLFDRIGIAPKQIRTLEDLQQLPVLTKSQVQQAAQEILSEAVPPREILMTHTSGTTGGGLKFPTTFDAKQQQWAIWWRYRRWHGFDRGAWFGYFGGRSVVPLTQVVPPFWRENRPGHQVFFSGYHMSQKNLPAYAAELRRRQLPWLHGYPSLLALMAGEILESGIDLGYQIRGITVSAENLLPQQAHLIERAFGVRPKQHYGLEEAVANISECEHGTLHVDEDFSAVEFLPNEDGPGHRIVGTGFTNLATPLLRYDTQDVVILSDAKCPCGRPGRIVESIDGRCEDYVVLKSGARVGRLDHVFKDLSEIREAQVYQRRAGEILIRVVRADDYTEKDEKRLLEEMRYRVGEDMEIRIEYVERVPRSPTGKLRLVVSDLKEGKLTMPATSASPESG